jgi:hypothetical protein
MLWCRYIVASAEDMLLVIEWVGEVELWSGSIIIQKSGQRSQSTGWDISGGELWLLRSLWKPFRHVCMS